MKSMALLNPYLKSLVAVAAWHEGEKAVALLDHCENAELQALRPMFEEVSGWPVEECLQKLHEFMAADEQGLMAEQAHAGWIYEMLRHETPLIAAAIIGVFREDRRRQVLAACPESFRQSVESALSQAHPLIECRQFLWQNFKRGFLAYPQLGAEEFAQWNRYAQLTAESLTLLMREVGIEEMNLAFGKVHRTATRAILNRLDPHDAKELRRRLRQDNQYALELRREAQVHILSLEIEKIKAEDLTTEIGFSVLSRALGSAAAFLGSLFVYKLPPRQGYVLKRYLDRYAVYTPSELSLKTRERLAAAFHKLFEKIPVDRLETSPYLVVDEAISLK